MRATPRQMLLRVPLLLILLVAGLAIGGMFGQLLLWIGGGLALYWLLREVLPALRGRHRP